MDEPRHNRIDAYEKYYAMDPSYKFERMDVQNIIDSIDKPRRNKKYDEINQVIMRLSILASDIARVALTSDNTDNKQRKIMREITELLDINQSIINQSGSEGDTIIHTLVFIGNYECCELAIKYGAYVSAIDKHGQTPLHRLVFTRDMRIIKLLTSNGLNINTQDYDGNTPLHLAVIVKNYDVIRELLNNKADQKITNRNNMKAIEYAVYRENNKMEADDKIITIFNEFKG